MNINEYTYIKEIYEESNNFNKIGFKMKIQKEEEGKNKENTKHKKLKFKVLDDKTKLSSSFK